MSCKLCHSKKILFINYGLLSGVRLICLDCGWKGFKRWLNIGDEIIV